jgi:hypothetical protein
MLRTHVSKAVLALMAVVALPVAAGAADQAPKSTPAPAPTHTTTAKPQHQMTIKEAMKKLGIVAFPTRGQTPAQADSEATECLMWAADQTGITAASMKDPHAAGQAAAAHVDSAAQGAAVKGAAKGAAVGAVIGGISGNAGAGAGYGAAGGAIAGRRAKKEATANAQANAEAKVHAENEAKKEALKKAMSACLETKGYNVK